MSREMPNAVSLEQSVLGSLMVYPKVIQDCQELDLHVEEFICLLISRFIRLSVQFMKMANLLT